jgi:hypothetical protein
VVCATEEVAVLPDMIEAPHEVALITVTVVPGARSNKAGAVVFERLQHPSPLPVSSPQQNWPWGHA